MLKTRLIGKSVRLISNVIEITEIKNIEVFLVTMDIKKAFDSLDLNFLIFTLKQYNFGETFIYGLRSH